jgi:hypothetical protein
MAPSSQYFYDELRRALPHYERACDAVAKVRDEVRAFRAKAKDLRAETRQGPPNQDREKVATEAWVRAEDLVSETIRALRETVDVAKKAVGLLIDAETAEIHWGWGETLDPYGVDPELPEEYQQIQRLYFARSPGSANWVCFYDLPEATRDALWKRLERGEFDRNEESPCCSLPGAM